MKLTASASTLRYKAVNRTEGLTLGFAERWRIQPCWRSFDRQPLSSMPHCHHTGRQSERLPWSTASLQIYHFKSRLTPWPASHLSAPTNTLHSFLYVVTCEGPFAQSKPAVTVPPLKHNRKIRITHHQILFHSNWQNRSDSDTNKLPYCSWWMTDEWLFQQLHI